jgi:uncharacterized protein YeeX (DUF496 family)
MIRLLSHFKLKGILPVIFCILAVSCATVAPKKPLEFFEDLSLTKNQVNYEIKQRENKIGDLRQRIRLLANYNEKFKSQIDFEDSYNKDATSLSRAYSKIEEIIAQNEREINRLNSEIRVLKRQKI